MCQYLGDRCCTSRLARKLSGIDHIVSRRRVTGGTTRLLAGCTFAISLDVLIPPMRFLPLLASEGAELIIGHTLAKRTLYFPTIRRQVYRAFQCTDSRPRRFVCLLG
jgi:hypothetical protein